VIGCVVLDKKKQGSGGMIRSFQLVFNIEAYKSGDAYISQVYRKGKLVTKCSMARSTIVVFTAPPLAMEAAR